MKKNILVGQSGGPTAVINASLYGIIKEAAAHSEQIGSVYGMINGIEGFLSGHIMDLSKELSDEDLELLRQNGCAHSFQEAFRSRSAFCGQRCLTVQKVIEL